MRTLASLVAIVGACHVNAEVKGSMNASESHASHEETVTSSPSRAPAAPPAERPPSAETTTPAPAPPPASACPLSCYVASGGDRVAVTDQELGQIRSGLEPALGRMRSCTGAESWRRHGSPTVHLRVAPDGSVSRVDVDPHHVYEREAGCMESIAGQPAAVSLPGRTTVRCVERCEPPRREKPRGEKR